MVKNVRIQEVGKVYRGDATYVIAVAIVTHNGIEIRKEHWRIPWDMNTAECAAAIAAEYDAEQWQYQTMWIHPTLETKPKPLRYIK